MMRSTVGLVAVLSGLTAAPAHLSAQAATVPPAQAPPTSAPAVAASFVDGQQSVPPALTAAAIEDFFDVAFDVQKQAHRLAGAVVSVVKDGEVVFQRGYGWADIDARVPADPERSLFRIASISKTFVWTSIMQLVEDGRLSIDDPVDRYVDFPIPATFEEPIRIRHLLTHTPGFEETWIGYGAESAEDVDDLGVALERLMPGRVRPPGEHASYSNYGSALAAYVVERISGQPWWAYVDDHILGPLGMTSTNTHTEVPPELRARLARGYRYSTGRFVATDYSYSQIGPAGMMSTTASDMARFMIAHLELGALGDVRILEEGTARRMQSPLFAPHPDLPPILHGFYRSDRNGQVVFGHGGDTNQFHSQMSLMPEHGLGIFVSFNTDPGAAARSELVPAFIDHFFPAEHLRAAPEAADIDLEEYTGFYIPLRSALTTHERLIGTSRGQWLSIREENLRQERGNNVWVPVGPDHFVHRYANQTLVFERDEAGEVTHVLVGSPLGTMRRAPWWESRDFVAALLAFSIVVSALAVLGWGYRAFRPAPEERRLPSPHVRLAGAAAVLLLATSAIGLGLAGDVVGGVPTGIHVAFWLSRVNLLLALVVTAFGVGQWVRAEGSRWTRLRYSVFTAALLAHAWLAWSYNFLTVPG